MRKILFFLVLGGMAVAGVFLLRKKGLSLSSIGNPGKDQQIQISTLNSPEGESEGAILGTQESMQVTHFGDRFAPVGNFLGKIASSLGMATVKTGETIVKNVSSTPNTQEEVIDMSRVVKEISGKIEAIPGNLVNQAKLEYCRQVLEQATGSALQQ